MAAVAAKKKTVSKKTETEKKVSTAKTEAPKTNKKKLSKFEPITVDFQFKAETPGTYRFEEIDSNGKVIPNKEAIVGGLYLRIKGTHNAPKKIRVIIEEA